MWYIFYLEVNMWVYRVSWYRNDVGINNIEGVCCWMNYIFLKNFLVFVCYSFGGLCDIVVVKVIRRNGIGVIERGW